MEEINVKDINLSELTVDDKVPLYIEFISGWIGGVGQILSAQPFDIIKVRLQT